MPVDPIYVDQPDNDDTTPVSEPAPPSPTPQPPAPPIDDGPIEVEPTTSPGPPPVQEVPSPARPVPGQVRERRNWLHNQARPLREIAQDWSFKLYSNQPTQLGDVGPGGRNYYDRGLNTPVSPGPADDDDGSAGGPTVPNPQPEPEPQPQGFDWYGVDWGLSSTWQTAPWPEYMNFTDPNTLPWGSGDIPWLDTLTGWDWQQGAPWGSGLPPYWESLDLDFNINLPSF